MAVYDYWLSVAVEGHMPARRDFRFSAYPDLIPRLLLWDCIDVASPQMFFAGRPDTGDLPKQGVEIFEALHGTPFGDALQRERQAMFAEPRGVLVHLTGHHDGASYGLRVLCLPLANLTGSPRYMLTFAEADGVTPDSGNVWVRLWAGAEDYKFLPIALFRGTPR